MSYKVYLPGPLSTLEWSQALWKSEKGRIVAVNDCEQELVHRVLLEHLPKEGLIVDAGCGTARLPIYFKRRGYRFVGLEIDHDACVIGKENESEVALAQADVVQIPLRSRSVDAVVSLGVLEHGEAGPLAALREARRILKLGGLLVLTVPYNNLFRRLLVNPLQDCATRRRRRAGMELRFNEYRFSKREVRDLLRRAGFEEVAVHPNDMLPPRTVGLWVDYNNLVLQYYEDGPRNLFRLPGLWGRIANLIQKCFPWLVCAEVAFVARAR